MLEDSPFLDLRNHLIYAVMQECRYLRKFRSPEVNPGADLKLFFHESWYGKRRRIRTEGNVTAPSDGQGVW